MKKIPIFYNEKQIAQNGGASPSPFKPKFIIEEWQKLNLPIEIIDFEPVTKEYYYSFHDKNFVDNVLDLKINNGFLNKDEKIAQALYWTSGSYLAAAKFALQNKIAMSPTSGFHHAEYSKAQGFCTFNGLIGAAKYLLDNGLVKKLAILDLDRHYGNGTDNIIKKFNLFDKIEHWTFGQYIDSKNDIFLFLSYLPKIIENFANHKCEIILCQLGADPHIDDEYNGVMATEEMKLRDQIVFEKCKELNIPIVWNLAGGYQSPIQKVIDLHTITMKECIKVYL